MQYLCKKLTNITNTRNFQDIPRNSKEFKFRSQLIIKLNFMNLKILKIIYFFVKLIVHEPQEKLGE